MSETVNLHFKYTEEEWVAASRLYVLRQPKLLLRFGIGFLLIALGLLVFALISEAILPFMFISLCAVVAAFAWSILFALPRQRFRSDPRFRDEFFLEFAEDAIRFKTQHIESRFDWSLYTGALENERLYILIYGKGMISVIPKRAFKMPSQEMVFRDMLQRKLMDISGSHWLKELPANESTGAYVPPAEPPDWR